MRNDDAYWQMIQSERNGKLMGGNDDIDSRAELRIWHLRQSLNELWKSPTVKDAAVSCYPPNLPTLGAKDL